MTVESILNLDVAKILGYFESCKGTFLLKYLLLLTISNDQDADVLDTSNIPEDRIEIVKEQFDYKLFFGALECKNNELKLNFMDDIVTAGMSSAWNIFELIIKDLLNENYAAADEDVRLAYAANRLGFDDREKKDIELFYYIRNAICHYNGAYYNYRSIDHRYQGIDFKSEDNEGNKIDNSIGLTWKIIDDLERLSIKAWNNISRRSA